MNDSTVPKSAQSEEVFAKHMGSLCVSSISCPSFNWGTEMKHIALALSTQRSDMALDTLVHTGNRTPYLRFLPGIFLVQYIYLRDSSFGFSNLRIWSIMTMNWWFLQKEENIWRTWLSHASYSAERYIRSNCICSGKSEKWLSCTSFYSLQSQS